VKLPVQVRLFSDETAAVDACVAALSQQSYGVAFSRVEALRIAALEWLKERQARPVDRYLRVSRLLRPRPFPLDLLVKTPEEIAQALAREDAFVHEITTRGRVLYEQAD
jgi:hypothetical protein